jgi:hypothetical protein
MLEPMMPPPPPPPIYGQEPKWTDDDVRAAIRGDRLRRAGKLPGWKPVVPSKAGAIGAAIILIIGFIMVGAGYTGVAVNESIIDYCLDHVTDCHANLTSAEINITISYVVIGLGFMVAGVGAGGAVIALANLSVAISKANE